MNSRCYQNSLAVFARKLEDGSGYVIACLFIQQTVLTASRNNMNLFLTYHIVNLIGINTGRIHNVSSMYHTIIGSDIIALLCLLHLLNRSLEEEFHAVFAGILCQSNI